MLCCHDAVKKGLFLSFPRQNGISDPMFMRPGMTLIMSSIALYEEELEKVARNGQMD